MLHTNLIPSYRLEARRRRRCIRAWTVGVTCYALALASVYAGYRATWGVDLDAVAGRRQATAQRIHATGRQIAYTQAELAEATCTLKANEVVGGHPDWSLLLMLLARSMNDEVVLRQCTLAPLKADGRTGAPGPADAGGWQLDMTGYGRTVTSVSHYALALERTGLFQEVRLIKTVRQPFLAGSATHFQIRCMLGSAAEGSP